MRSLYLMKVSNFTAMAAMYETTPCFEKLTKLKIQDKMPRLEPGELDNADANLVPEVIEGSRAKQNRSTFEEVRGRDTIHRGMNNELCEGLHADGISLPRSHGHLASGDSTDEIVNFRETGIFFPRKSNYIIRNRGWDRILCTTPDPKIPEFYSYRNKALRKQENVKCVHLEQTLKMGLK